MKIFHALAACFTMILATAGIGALAQQPNAARPSGAPPAIVPESGQQLDPAAVSGPTIYVVDILQRLVTINLGTFAVHFVGQAGLGTELTYIAFQPGTHKLYGVSFSQFFSVNTTTGRTTLIGNLGVSDANALEFNSLGEAFSAGLNSGELYKINVKTGVASVIGKMGGYSSAGDLVFYNDTLVLAGFKGCCNVGPTTPNYLVTLNQNTGAVVGTPVLMSSHQIYGLVSTGKNELFGLADIGTNTAMPGLYKFVPTNPVGHRDILLKNLFNSGVEQILGAAYDGNFQP